MTQSPDNMGGLPDDGRPADPVPTDPVPTDPVPGDQDVSPPTVPPPSSWHFAPEPTSQPQPDPAPVPAAAAPPNGSLPLNGSQAPYGTSPHYGTPSAGMHPAGPTPQGYAGYRTGYPPYQGASGREPGLAEWWRRLLGRLIDIVVVSIVLMPVTIPLLSGPFGKLEQIANQYPNLSTPGAQSALNKADSKFLIALWILALIAAAVWFLYDALQHAKWGQTLGKRALSTRVVSAYDRSPITGAAAAKRAAVYALVPIIPVVGTVFAVLNGMWLLWDRRRQCLHDKVGRTIVIRTNVPATSQWQPSAW
jgi:uncharacterized RDD family membrane protein YckC